MNLTQSTLAQQLAALQAKEVSSVELVTEQLARAKALNPTLNAFVSFQEDSALAQAKQADQLRQDGSDAPLLGAPIAHKDLFCTQGHQTTAGSKILANFVAPYDATVVENLANAGAISIGNNGTPARTRPTDNDAGDKRQPRCTTNDNRHDDSRGDDTAAAAAAGGDDKDDGRGDGNDDHNTPTHTTKHILNPASTMPTTTQTQCNTKPADNT